MPLRSTAMQRSQSSGLRSSTLPVGPAMPALLTNTSSPPRFFCTSWNNFSTWPRSATSARVSGLVLGSISLVWTRAPCSRNVCAMARPMPAPPAVTSTRSPLAEVSMPGDNSAGLGESVPLNASPDNTRVSLEQEELRGISRTVAEIHWLLLILVLVYLIFSGARDDGETSAAISAGLMFYAAMIMAFRYANFYKSETRWKIAIETVGMIAFTTWVIWFAGRLSSPLLNLYLLPVITAAL